VAAFHQAAADGFDQNGIVHCTDLNIAGI